MRNIRIKSIIAQNLLIARKCKGLNHVELVNLSSVTRPVISGIENASVNSTFDTISKLSSVLGISIEMLLLGKTRFNQLHKLLKNQYKQEFTGEREIYYPDKIWNSLLKLSANKEKKNYKNIVSLCRQLINLNFPTISVELTNIMLYSGVQGIIFSEEGIKQGFEFGIWLCNNLFNVSENEK